MSIAICPECGGEGSRPQRDNPYLTISEQCRHCRGVGHLEEGGPIIESIIIAFCDCCGAERALTRCWLGEMETFACERCRS